MAEVIDISPSKFHTHLTCVVPESCLYDSVNIGTQRGRTSDPGSIAIVSTG